MQSVLPVGGDRDPHPDHTWEPPHWTMRVVAASEPQNALKPSSVIVGTYPAHDAFARAEGRSQIMLRRLLLESIRRAFPGDSRMVEHIDPVGMRQRERDVLLAKQYGDRRRQAQFFERL